MEDRMKSRIVFIIVALIGIVSFGGAQTNTQNLPFGAAAYDSGWVVVNMPLMTLNHNLGADVDDYFVDLEFRSLATGEGAPGIHNKLMGCDTSGATANEERGAEIYSITSSNVYIRVGADDTLVDEIRLRIWFAAAAAWDSDWIARTSGSFVILTHSLGGNPDDYLVDLTFKTSGGTVHKRSIGIDSYMGGSLQDKGGAWYALDDSLIKIWIGDEDTAINEFRVRIFQPPTPDYSSGWIALSQGNTQTLVHDLGGPWNDYFVVMDHKDSDQDWGINNISSGGDDYSDSHWYGAAWSNLTAQSVILERLEHDYVADFVRIRIWADRSPSYDSGWTAIPADHSTAFSHNLGGNPDRYIIDMQFRDSDNDRFEGINQGSYGIDQMYNQGTSSWDIQGAAWHSLTDSVVYVERGVQDTGADEVRIRIWQAPDPDDDSGWISITAGTSDTYTHGVGGSTASSYIVDLECRSGGLGINQISLGGDRSLDASLSSVVGLGAYWNELGTSSIKLTRLPDDNTCEEYRVRIWNGTDFDWTGVRTVSAPWSYTFTHGLDAAPEDMVVSVISRDSSDLTYLGRDIGEDRFYWGGILTYGVFWEDLKSDTIKLNRGADDSENDTVTVRLWLAGSTEIFSDDFESGLLTAWSGTVGGP